MTGSNIAVLNGCHRYHLTSRTSPWVRVGGKLVKVRGIKQADRVWELGGSLSECTEKC